LDDARRTIAIHRVAFERAGLTSAWRRIIALVLHPGVEFNHDSVVEYDSEKTQDLRRLLRDEPTLVFEAHSTDYQRPEAYGRLVQDGFAILKVGPALTFALREALFALASIEERLIEPEERSRLTHVLESTMLAEPKYWASHYLGDKEQQSLLRSYSYSDRIRYYWSEPLVIRAVDKLLKNLECVRIPENMLSQHLPEQYWAIRRGKIALKPREIIVHKIQQSLVPYSDACNAPSGTIC
jgi:D-tagatose-1,6-bisphosphate aldolase subunit GatZ/KbaZ